VLAFELTETAAVRDLDAARAFTHALTELGCDVALDDFGTGLRSYTYLKHLSAGYVKIDVEFIRDVARSPVDRHVVRSIVDVAHALGKVAVAEGVEDQATLDAVRRLGVDWARASTWAGPCRSEPERDGAAPQAAPLLRLDPATRYLVQGAFLRALNFAPLVSVNWTLIGRPPSGTPSTRTSAKTPFTLAFLKIEAEVLTTAFFTPDCGSCNGTFVTWKASARGAFVRRELCREQRVDGQRAGRRAAFQHEPPVLFD